VVNKLNKIQERRNRIIESVVSAFLETGEPVNSGYVAIDSRLGVSSATIRNTMKDLESEGFLYKPHTSAGRIPTVKCYQYYVKHLMPHINLAEDDLQAIKRLVKNVIKENDADIFMNHIASVISEVTHLIGITMSPLFERGIFERLEIMNIGGSRYLLVISLKSGLVKTINFTVNQVIPRIKIEETARLLTNRLYGLTVFEIKKSIGNRIKGISGGERKLFDIILNKREQIFNLSEDKGIHIAGLSRLLLYPDFTPVKCSQKLADLFENKYEIANLLKQTMLEDEDVNINIGGSGLLRSNPPLSLVSAIYHLSDTPGVVAAIGPTRIHYPKLLAIMKYTASVTSHFFSS